MAGELALHSESRTPLMPTPATGNFSPPFGLFLFVGMVVGDCDGILWSSIHCSVHHGSHICAAYGCYVVLGALYLGQVPPWVYWGLRHLCWKAKLATVQRVVVFCARHRMRV
nr:hypothetical protein Iba_chr07dCG5000 [Ipomoea batatas]